MRYHRYSLFPLPGFQPTRSSKWRLPETVSKWLLSGIFSPTDCACPRERASSQSHAGAGAHSLPLSSPAGRLAVIECWAVPLSEGSLCLLLAQTQIPRARWLRAFQSGPGGEEHGPKKPQVLGTGEVRSFKYYPARTTKFSLQ